MNRKLVLSVAMLALIGGFALAQDLVIDYRVNVAAPDTANYFTFKGPIRYMASEKDTLDATTGASKFGSTHTFMPYLYDVKGQNVLPDGLRGLFLYAIAPVTQRDVDNLTVTKASDGTIVVQYVHRGTAYRLTTDKSGKFTFPKGSYDKRLVGDTKNIISTDFSADKSVSKIDWKKVWNDKIAAGTVISGSTKTGAIMSDGDVPSSYFYWDGALQVALDRNILTISGGLAAVNR